MTTTRFFEPYRPRGEANALLARVEFFDDMLEVRRTKARSFAEADGVAVIRRDGDQVAYVGKDAISPLWSCRRFPIRQRVSGVTILAREPIIIADLAEDGRISSSAGGIARCSVARPSASEMRFEIRSSLRANATRTWRL